MRTVPHCDPTGRAGMPQMPTSNRTDCRHGHGAQPHAVVHVVLGRLPGRQPDPRHVGRPVPTATRALALRDSLSDSPQTACRNGPPGPGSHRWLRAGHMPEELAKEFEPSAQGIRNWVAQADRDEGRREDGLTTAEREELNRLRRENRQLKLEREILSKAAAWFARETDVIPPRGSNS